MIYCVYSLELPRFILYENEKISLLCLLTCRYDRHLVVPINPVSNTFLWPLSVRAIEVRMYFDIVSMKYKQTHVVMIFLFILSTDFVPGDKMHALFISNFKV